MPSKLLAYAGLLAWVLGACPQAAFAQASSGGPRSGFPLIERLGDLGRAIFGPSAGEEESRLRASHAEPAPRRIRSERSIPDLAPRIAGASEGGFRSAAAEPATVRIPQSPDRQSASATSGGPGHSPASDSGNRGPVALSPVPGPNAPAATSESFVLAPLHERLSAVRQSAFGPSAQPAEGHASGPPAPTLPGASLPQRTGADSTATGVARGAQAAPEPGAGRIASNAAIAPGVPSTPSLSTSVPTPSGSSAAAGHRPAVSGFGVAGPRALGPQGTGTGSLAHAKPSREVGKPPQSGRFGKTAEAQAVLFARHGPQLGVQTIGPRRILVGKESVYELVMENSGDVAAEELIVTVELPEWADVMAAEASAGSTTAKAGPGGAPFRWRIGRLEAKAKERLVLRIVPRQSRPFELAVKWDYTPVMSQAQIEVQEPKLAVALHGPREVLYGKAEIYKLEVANIGNGDAENVEIWLSPSAPGDKPAPATHQFGTLPAGQRKTIDVELTARQTGNLTIHIEARADGGLKAQRMEQVLVRRAAVKIDVEAPKVHFVGTEATYRIRVTNTGNAPAPRPTITAALPPGAKYVRSPQNPRVGVDGNKVVWNLDDLAPGSEAVCVMTCTVEQPGPSRLEVQCVAEGDVTAAASATTQAEAIASLTLSVDDPAGPVPLETDATYHIQVQNRGTASAERVEVLVYFSNGIEPVSAEGGPYKISPGQVLFEPIASLPAGQSTVLKVKAKAETAGNHLYRIEVRSEPAGTRVVREGTTRFYSSSGPGPNEAIARPSGPAAASDDVRTASRSQPSRSGPQPDSPTLAPPRRESPAWPSPQK